MSLHEDLFPSEIESLRSEVTGLKVQLTEKDERLKLYQEEFERLHEIIREFKRQQFGKKSERWESPEQLLFNEAEVLAKSEKPEDEESAEAVSDQTDATKPAKPRGKRKPLPKELPREVVVLELPEENRLGSNGLPMRPIGKEISEKLIYEPAVMKVVEYHRIRYGEDSGDTGVIAPPVPSVVPKGIVTASLLAWIVLQKYGYGIPLYRQEEMFARMGVDLHRCTMARWVIQGAEACMAIKNVLQDRLMASPYVSCDETHVQVLKEKGRTAESKSWMWVRCTPSDIKKIILFDYDPHRSAAVASRLFADYTGTLQVDGFDSYNDAGSQDGVIRVGCNMHGRRYFESARKVGAKQGHTLAETALEYYRKLYEIEERARSMSWDERHMLRQKESVPIWDEFKSWADVYEKKVPPKSKIGKALQYFKNEYHYLIGYLKDGRLEMDNGFAERAIKSFAIGRKNWLFSSTEVGAEASSFFYSIVVSAKINGNDPYQILKTIFEQIPLAQTAEDIERLADLIITRPATV